MVLGIRTPKLIIIFEVINFRIKTFLLKKKNKKIGNQSNVRNVKYVYITKVDNINSNSNM